MKTIHFRIGDMATFSYVLLSHLFNFYLHLVLFSLFWEKFCAFVHISRGDKRHKPTDSTKFHIYCVLKLKHQRKIRARMIFFLCVCDSVSVAVVEINTISFAINLYRNCHRVENVRKSSMPWVNVCPFQLYEISLVNLNWEMLEKKNGLGKINSLR